MFVVSVFIFVVVVLGVVVSAFTLVLFALILSVLKSCWLVGGWEAILMNMGISVGGADGMLLKTATLELKLFMWMMRMVE